MAARLRSLVMAVVPVVACSDGGGAAIDAALDAPVDAPIDAAVDAPPDAAVDAPVAVAGRHGYVVSRVRVPTTPVEATMLGFDIDQAPNDANGGIDNQLGTVLANLGTLMPDLALGPPTDDAVDRGLALTLVDLEVAGPPEAAVRIGLGADPQPPPCAGANDTVCRRHLAGTGSFGRAGAPGAPFPGTLTQGRFAGGPGTFPLALAFTEGVVTVVPVERAQAELRMVTDDGIPSGQLGGAIRLTDFDAIVLPAMHQAVGVVYDRDCPLPRTPPSCGCGGPSTGRSLQSALDTDDDCTITLAEVRAFFTGLVTPDLDLDGDGLRDGVSIGVGVEAVAGSFPPP